MDKHINGKKFLNSGSYFQLLKLEKDPDVLEYIEDTVKTCTDYVQRVDMMETQLITARFRMDQERYQSFIVDIDAQRRRCHNDAISSMGFLNRTAQSHGLDPIFTGDQKDRYQVADFCLELTNAIFENRKR